MPLRCPNQPATLVPLSGIARPEALMPALAGAKLGFAFSLRSFGKAASSTLAPHHAKTGPSSVTRSFGRSSPSVSLSDYLALGPMLPLQIHARHSFSFPIYGRCRLGSRTFAVDVACAGFSLSVRHFAAACRLLPALSFAHVGPTPLLQSSACFGLVLSALQSCYSESLTLARAYA